ncbi:MAG TPA: flagellar biosynthetic protein FliR [Methylomusa anaerophila]|nr:flagellar biosynthetic protein FliR [Methylomusa anaerophila]HML86998.1 flagellar biosynthetic protein FliR [Methylomusa anaerophila]
MQNQFGLFLLVFARISGIFSVAPIFGSRNIPLAVKAGMSLLLTYILVPLLAYPDFTIPNALFAYILLVISEFLVGLIIAFAASMAFNAIQMAGSIIDTQIGFGIVNVLDPQFGQQTPLIGNFKYILALVIFLTTNSHHLLLSALFSSFQLIPVTKAVYHPSISDIIVNMVVGIFVIALKISLPVLVSLLLTDVALGILSRTMPQMNIFIVGMPGKIIVGIFVLSLALPFYIMFLEVVFNDMFRNIYHLMASMGRL